MFVGIHLRAFPGDIADNEDYHDEATENPSIKHILEFYTGNGKGIAFTLNKSIIEYPIQLIQIQIQIQCIMYNDVDVDVFYQGTAVHVRSDPIKQLEGVK